jgi:hypothetical protein
LLCGSHGADTALMGKIISLVFDAVVFITFGNLLDPNIALI